MPIHISTDFPLHIAPCFTAHMLSDMNTALMPAAKTHRAHNRPAYMSRKGPPSGQRPPGRSDRSRRPNNTRPTSSTAILLASELPGPMSMRHLNDVGALQALDDSSAYLSESASTLYGRGTIASSMMPFGTVACAMTAAWVWLGGEFPRTLDILSSSHFRTPVHGRRIKVFNRILPNTQITSIGDLRITTPVRTACDIALLNETDLMHEYATETVRALMEEYGFTPTACLGIIDDNKYCRNSPQARQFFATVQQWY